MDSSKRIFSAGFPLQTPPTKSPKVVELFKHESLNLAKFSLRTLDLLPQEENECIRCTIQHRDPQPGLQLTAVSYEWVAVGSERHTIYINNRPFEVRHNLFLFLKTLLMLFPNGYRNLWIDALSIDQHNQKERNRQVGHMRRIYEMASETFIWLGPAAGMSDELFSLLNTLNIPITGEVSSVQAVARLTKEQWKTAQNTVLCAGIDIWKACDALCRRTYWSRTWIIQELLFAKKPTLICGSKMSPWHA